ncbi:MULTISPECIES: hypothetical protein [unclassified Aureimonas]|uniref:hypothetical protein n=1 Tax=unclassified Aureimonas TaxID=2615206 RepID=UPI0006FF1499|nr:MULTISPECIES: hypothetical protein [unclassified Aureimonas]KQT60580.1 hypothetical protein ASG62_08060 [Aureimonas sp. Leaf427]KQT79455.1 hypothetical protein ASG54_10655 [Aureimonas sp. Leaf460]
MLLVTGTSGVGKTFTIEAAIRFNISLLRLSGSGILRSLDRPVAGLSDVEADENQTAILEFLGRIPDAEAPNILFDGHAVLETENGLWPIPLSIVDQMRIDGVALVADSVSAVALRRKAKGRSSTFADVTGLQKMEELRSRRIAQHLSVPYACVQSGDAPAMVRFLEAVRRPRGEDSR